MTDRDRLRVSVCQWRPPEPGTTTTDEVAQTIDRLATETDLVVFPELTLTGYHLTTSLADAAVPAIGRWSEPIAAAARRAAAVVAVGFPERDGDAVYNSVLVVDSDGSVAGVHRKTHLFGNEPSLFSPGRALDPIPTSVGVLGVLICYDVEFPEAARTLTARGADLLVVPTANMAPYGSYHDVYMRARAMENGVPLAIANYVGPDVRFEFLGRSGIVSPSGELLAVGSDTHAECLTAEVSMRSPDDTSLQYLAHLRPALYEPAPLSSAHAHDRPFPPG